MPPTEIDASSLTYQPLQYLLFRDIRFSVKEFFIHSVKEEAEAGIGKSLSVHY